MDKQVSTKTTTCVCPFCGKAMDKADLRLHLLTVHPVSYRKMLMQQQQQLIPENI